MTDPTITTTATGRREATPDLATVGVVVIDDGESAATARETTRDRVATLRNSSDAVPAERIRTVDFRVEATLEMFEPETEASYQGTARLEVDCVPETVEAVVTEVTDAGGTVRDVSFELHETVRRRLRDEALTAATERAREKAERIATAEGGAVGDLRAVTTGRESSGMDSIVDDALASNPDTDVRPTPIVVSETVEAVYEFAPQ